VSPVRYELGLYIPEDDILRSHLCEILKSYIARARFPPNVNFLHFVHTPEF
jgi:hypothetical protein